MKYPIIDEIPSAKEILTYFAGYSHKPTCQEGSFYDQKNISTDKFPALTTRKLRTKITVSGGLYGLAAFGDTLYSGYRVMLNEYALDIREPGKPATTQGIRNLTTAPKNFIKMGKKIIILPQKIEYWVDDNGKPADRSFDAEFEANNQDIVLQMVDADGDAITLWDGSGDPEDGAYRINTSGDKKSLQVYSSSTRMWMNVASTYFAIKKAVPLDKTSSGVQQFSGFKKGDGIKISVTGITYKKSGSTYSNWKYAKNVFVNDDGDSKRSGNFTIHKIDNNGFPIVTGILDTASRTVKASLFRIERKSPDMDFVIECQNRLWGCAKDGHEIYASALGDPTNWNVFSGVSTDSWAATVGSVGEFTGAVSYMGNPIFFKENQILKVTISGYGAHSYKEYQSRGVAKDAGESIALVNELLYYKSPTGVCVYDGNFPQDIGEDLGEIRSANSVGGSYKGKYYLCAQDMDYTPYIYVYDTSNNLWTKEDNQRVYRFITTPTSFMAAIDDKNWHRDLYVLDGAVPAFGISTMPETVPIKTKESEIRWMAESGWIGYSTDSKKYLAKLGIRMQLAIGAYVQLFIEYDSSGVWEHVWNVSGKGTKSFTIPVRPKRCDHYRYRLVGYGEATIFSIAKTYEEGSDM